MDFLIRERYNEYIKDNSALGRGTAHSYVTALDILRQVRSSHVNDLCWNSSGFGFDKYSIMEYKGGV
jgi:hypothetical protein